MRQSVSSVVSVVFQVTQLTSSQKALAKVDKTGMKSISSFFSPKLNKRNNS